MRKPRPISGIANHGAGYIASAGYDTQPILWNSKTKRFVAHALHDQLVNQCEFSPGGNLLFTASSGHSAKPWSVPDMRPRLALTGRSDDVSKAPFARSGEMIATSLNDCALNVYSGKRKLPHRFAGHSWIIQSFDWSENSKGTFSCRTKGTVRALDAFNGDELSCRETKDVNMDALAILFVIGNHKRCSIQIDENCTRQSIESHSPKVKRFVANVSDHRILGLVVDQNAVLSERGDEWLIVEPERSKYPAVVWAGSATFNDDNTIAFAMFGSTYAVWHIGEGRWDLDGIVPSVSRNAAIVRSGNALSIGDAGQPKHGDAVTCVLDTLCNIFLAVDYMMINDGQAAAIDGAVIVRGICRCSSLLNCGFAFLARDVAFADAGGDTVDLIIFCCIGANDDGSLVTREIYGGKVAIYAFDDRPFGDAVRRPTSAGTLSLTENRDNGCIFAQSYDGNIYDVELVLPTVH